MNENARGPRNDDGRPTRRHDARSFFLKETKNEIVVAKSKIYIFWTVNGRLKGKTLWEKGIGFEHISDCELSKWSLFDCTAVLPVVFFVIHVPLSFVDPFFAFDNASTSTREACNSTQKPNISGFTEKHICIKNKEYGAKILKNPDEENIIKYINT